jgi:hypothetical protein
MSILHMRRNVKRRILAREESGERCSAPHEYQRASLRAEGAAEVPAPAAPAKPRAPRRRKAKAKRKA